jgi:hypothetical protein
MNHRRLKIMGALGHAMLVAMVVLCCVDSSRAQGSDSERAFPQSKATIEKSLKDMQPSTAGRLPVLDGFAAAAEHPLDHYQRGYFQSKFQVSTAPSGGSIVRVSVQITAWYADPAANRSGYQVLTSNGRLEGDLLDQLSEQLAGKASAAKTSAPNAARKPFPSEQAASSQPAKPSAGTLSETPDNSEPALSAPVPRLPESGSFSTSLAQGLAEQQKAGIAKNEQLDKDRSAMQAEAQNLEEILRNQAHPKNLVAIKKNGTPVVGSASLTAKTLFLASAHDEFEMLDFTRDWVHVRISGLSRGWIWRNNLEMPDSVPDSDAPPSPLPAAAEMFHISREESAPFPGDWAPLRGKSVKIVSVEKINEGEKDAGPQVRLEFAKSVLDKDYAELEQKAQMLAGIVVIFDSVDGGMIAVPFPILQQWKAGKLTDAALWHQCFFDPPETFSESGTSASQ